MSFDSPAETEVVRSRAVESETFFEESESVENVWLRLLFYFVEINNRLTSWFMLIMKATLGYGSAPCFFSLRSSSPMRAPIRLWLLSVSLEDFLKFHSLFLSFIVIFLFSILFFIPHELISCPGWKRWYLPLCLDLFLFLRYSHFPIGRRRRPNVQGIWVGGPIPFYFF